MILLFTLSMPNIGSWNGKWTGEGNLYAKTRTFRRKDDIKIANKLEGTYYYNFGDGWSASIKVEKISSSDAKKINKKSHGFCGYEWMIDSIIKNGDIRVPERSNY